MQSEIKKNEEITASSEQAAKLKALFPSCFDAEGRFRPDKLEDLLQADGADITREGYKLDWLGKSYARLLANLKAETLLAPNSEHNTKPENAESQNLLIQGDNLDVLKHLVNAYCEKVKTIYIDPPYNTGSDGFVYSDDRKFTPKQLTQLAGLEEDEAKRILEFTQSKSNSHSAWLTFMYPRLYVARELMRDDGVIFISIDDNEQAQLKLLCDEVFGAENFLGIACRATGQTTGQDGGGLGASFDFVLTYGRSRTFDLSGLPLTPHDLKRFDNEDSRGVFAYDQMLKTGSNDRRSDRENLFYGITDPDGNEVLPIASAGYEGTWRFNEEAYDDLLERDYIYWKRTKRFGSEVWWPYVKYYLEDRTKRPSPLWDDLDGNKKAARDLRDIFDGKKVFSFPKPVGLVKRCALIAPNSGPNDIVLDFFSGSGVAAHAVMELNLADDGKRQCISVQLDEAVSETSEAFELGYKTVFEVTRERISRVAAKLRAENPEATCDFGFKEFKTIPANEGAFLNYLDDADTIEDFVPFDGLALDDYALNALLTTWKVYDGLPLHQDLAPIDLGGYTAHLGEHILYFAHKGLELSHITELLRRIDEDKTFAPRKLVVFHHVLGDKILREFSEAVNAPNRKHLELTFEQRF